MSSVAMQRQAAESSGEFDREPEIGRLPGLIDGSWRHVPEIGWRIPVPRRTTPLMPRVEIREAAADGRRQRGNEK